MPRSQLKDLSARLVQAQGNRAPPPYRESCTMRWDNRSQAVLVEVAQSLGRPGSAFRRINCAVTSENRQEPGGKSAVRVIRNMSLLLRPSMLDDLGLIPALKWQA